MAIAALLAQTFTVAEWLGNSHSGSIQLSVCGSVSRQPGRSRDFSPDQGFENLQLPAEDMTRLSSC